MDRTTDRHTNKPHELYIYVGLTQARPKNLQKLIYQFYKNFALNIICYMVVKECLQKKNTFILQYLLYYVRCQMVFKSSNYTTITFIIPYLNYLCVGR